MQNRSWEFCDFCYGRPFKAQERKEIKSEMFFFPCWFNSNEFSKTTRTSIHAVHRVSGGETCGKSTEVALIYSLLHSIFQATLKMSGSRAISLPPDWRHRTSAFGSHSIPPTKGKKEYASTYPTGQHIQPVSFSHFPQWFLDPLLWTMSGPLSDTRVYIGRVPREGSLLFPLVGTWN